jgi:DNA polymerase III subunit gamma/tau
MSYQVLARKWRPKSFAEVVGQDQVLTVLSNALTLGRVHHAYLFSGTRGVGKTSIARLLAKGLNCERGVTATPCGECDNCRDIEQGRFVDLLEIDAASRTKVEDTREILDNIQYLPTRGRYKVYLIDEVHMLSRSSFNALLKTLEEPPEHVKFLLATTDPQKLPITILSRCLHLHLKVLSITQIEKQLAYIFQAEALTVQPRALQLLAKAANGSMRDALSLTDQAIALGNGQVDAEVVMLMLGSLDEHVPFSLVESLLNADGNKLLAYISQAAEQGVDWSTLLTDTAALLHQIAMLQVIPTALGEYQHQEERIRHLAKMLTPQDIQLYYQILLEGQKTLNSVEDKKMVVEMTFLRALAFQPKVFQACHSSLSSTKETRVETSPTPLSATPPALSQDRPSAIESKTNRVETKVKVEPEQAQPSHTSLEPGFSTVTQQILQAREKLVKQSDNKPKKSERVASAPLIKSSRLEQVKQNNHTPTQPLSALDQIEPHPAEVNAESYQWQASNQVEMVNTSLAPKHLRHIVEHEKTPELVKKLIAEAVKVDNWSAEIEQLNLSPMLKQLAINAFVEPLSDEQLVLHLRSSQAHMNKQNNRQLLQQLLSTHRGKSLTLDIVIDDSQTAKTPLEWREVIYQQKLIEAKKAIHSDNKIALLCQFFDAQIDEESIRPV